MSQNLPQFLTDLIATTPPAGQGVHGWLFRAARHLHTHLPAPEIVQVLTARVAGCGRGVSQQEIEDAVANSLRVAWRPGGNAGGGARAANAKWPSPNVLRIEQIVTTSGFGLADLWEASPLRLDDDEQQTEAIIDHLFVSDTLLCCGHTNNNFRTASRDEWRGKLSRLQLIVPNPSTDRCGLTQDGRVSAHALSITVPRKYLVIECDFAITDRSGKKETVYAPLIRRLANTGIEIADICAAILLHLATMGPMVMALHSGGKSLHGWFRVEGVPENKVLQFFQYAVSLGADPATWGRSQFVRMPDGTRDNGKRQVVYFLNPGLLKKGST